MRILTVFGATAAAILIGGCGPRQAGSEPEANQAAPAPTAPAAPAPAPTENGSAVAAAPKASAPFIPQSGTTIPAAFQGVYEPRVANCSSPSQERTTITPTELRWHETIGKVQSTLHRRENELEVNAAYQGEGEFWRSNRLLTLDQGGARLVIDSDGDSRGMQVFRCPAGTR
jgi:hypothetical protein